MFELCTQKWYSHRHTASLTAQEPPTNERFSLGVEWFDQVSQTVKDLRLFVYLDDDSVEIVPLSSLTHTRQFDPKQRKTFLKRSPHASIPQQSLTIGSSLNVYSRQLVICNYADEFTRAQLAVHLERCAVKEIIYFSALVVVPEVKALGKVLEVLLREGFGIVHAECVDLSAVRQFSGCVASFKLSLFQDRCR